MNQHFKNDLGAAFVGALSTLPQVVAYGLIAVSPLGPDWAVFGITASVGSAIFFGIVTALMGTNRFLVSGPRAVTALVLAVGIDAGLQRGYEPEIAIGLAVTGVVLAGLLQVVAGLLRLGQIVSYMPVPVLAGFVTASALLVVFSSLPMVLGVSEMTLLQFMLSDYATLNVWALTVGGLTIFFNLVLEGRIRFIPAALAALVIGTLVYYIGIQVMGRPVGPEVGHIDLAELLRVPMLIDIGFGLEQITADIDIILLTGITIGLLASFDTVLSSSSLDMMNNSGHQPNHDLKVHGGMNMIMGLFGFLPGSGTLSRSTAIINSGGESRLANAGVGIIFTLMLVLLATIVAALPLWATAGMLVATSLQAIDRPTLQKLWEMIYHKVEYRRVLAGDVVVTLVVVITALLFDLIIAVGVGVVLAILLFVLGMGRDPVRRAYFGSKIHSKVQRPIQQMEWLQHEGKRIAVIEVHGALFFGSSARLHARARILLDQGVEYLIIDFRNLTTIDSNGTSLLRRLHLMCLEAGGKLILSCVERERRSKRLPTQRAEKEQRAEERRKNVLIPRLVWLNLVANRIIETIGDEWIFDDTDMALATCEDLLLTRMGKADSGNHPGIIASSSLLEDLELEQIIELGRYARRQYFRAGDTIFNQGDAGEEVYFLVRGRMDVLIDIPGSSRKRRVSALTEGTLFGEMAVMNSETRSATVNAARHSSCFSIDRENFEILKVEKPEIVIVLMRNLAKLLADRLRMANTMISELEQ